MKFGDKVTVLGLQQVVNGQPVNLQEQTGLVDVMFKQNMGPMVRVEGHNRQDYLGVLPGQPLPPGFEPSKK